MIEINLVPDIKQEFLRSQRLRAKVISGAILASLAAGGVVVFLGMLMVAQNVRELIADTSIKDQYNKLIQNNPNVNEVVTIQQQLSNISTVNDNKKVSSRMFDLLTAINPKEPDNVRMTKVSVDPVKNTIQVEGSAENGFNAVDAFKKTILNTSITYTASNKAQTTPLATDVTIGKTSLGEDTSGKKVLRFNLDFNFPKELLSNQVVDLKIVTPTETIDVTDSKQRVPDSLFTEAAKDIEGGQ